MSPGPPKSATTGTAPHARASKTTPPPKSRTDGKTRTSEDRKHLSVSAWLTHPRKTTFFSIQSLHQLLKVVSLRPIAEHRKAGQIASQKGRSRAQSKVTSLPGHQAAHKNQF